MSKPLSPAAQAVLDAIGIPVGSSLFPVACGFSALALRALADHQIPITLDGPACHWTPTPHTRSKLRNIADELDGIYSGAEGGIAAELAQPDPDRSCEAFAIVQKRLDQLAGDQELMIYSWPNGEWSIEHTNPSPHVQLGEVSGKYSSDGLTLEQAVCNLAALLPENHASQTEAP